MKNDMENSLAQKSLNPGYTDYFGFDLGDGESAIAWARPGRRTEPQMLEFKGRKSIVTAIGRHPQKGLLIGEEACHSSSLEWLETRFKSRYLTDRKNAGVRIEQFARTLIEALKDSGRIEDMDKACFFIGCPSGWDQKTRESYKQHFLNAGIMHCEVISESRAAFMFARESGEISVSDDLLTRPTLIIDAGSSTTDFTYVADLSEKSLQVSDFGEVSLGGGLIDKMVLDMNLERSAYKAEIMPMLKRYRAYSARCEIEARRVKEMYFNQPSLSGSMVCESAVKLYAGHTPITLDISLSDADMKKILTTSVEQLNGQSFEGAYRRSLLQAKKQLKDAPPEVVLLTGGASRMPLMKQIAKEIFPQARVLHGLEPEYAIARGLCHALRIDRKAAAFAEEVHRLIESDDMEQLVMSRLGNLYEAFSTVLTDYMIDKIIPQTFMRWRSGDIQTIEDISTEITDTVYHPNQSAELKQLLAPEIHNWLEMLRPDIEDMTDPICRKYDLPLTAMHLTADKGIDPGKVTVDTDSLLQMNELGVAVDVVIGVIMAALLGGGGVALLASGLPGLLAGFVIGVIGAVIGQEAAKRMIYRSSLPAKVRKALPMGLLTRLFKSRRSSLRCDVYAQLMKAVEPPAQEVENTVKTIAVSIEQQLEMMIARATLLIH